MPTTRAQTPRIMLVDGHSVAFRAYYAIPDTVRDARERPANAVYGFMNTLYRTLQDHGPTHAAVTFDLGAPFREAMFSGYKASRDMGPEDLEPQVEVIRNLLDALAIPVYELEGFEADDLLATLTRQARAERFEVDVLSGDLDVLQLVRPGVRVVTPGKTFSEPVVYDEVRVVERYGVPPGKLRDWKALVGDASDEIPGVQGIGKRSATELLQRFESLDEIYGSLEAIESARVRNALAAGRESAALSRQLVTLRDDAPVELDFATAKLGGFDREAAVRLFQEMGFNGLARRMPEW